MRYFIVGNGTYSVMMKKYIEMTENVKIEGFIADAKCINETMMEGVMVIAKEEFVKQMLPEDINLYMGVGYSSMGRVRKMLFEELSGLGYCFNNYIHPSCIIHADVVMGSANNILEGVIIEQGCSIGDGNLLFAGAILGHGSLMGNYNTMSIRATSGGCVEIGNNCFFGVSSAVRDHVCVADYTLIGAAAYAAKSTEKESVWKAPLARIDERCSLDYF